MQERTPVIVTPKLTKDKVMDDWMQNKINKIGTDTQEPAPVEDEWNTHRHAE